jgi:DNA-binding CsgD family transcriptional regulator
MSGSKPQFSAKVAEFLRNADRTIRYLPPGDHRKLYNLWRVTMGTLAPVDAFYVAFFRDDRYLVVPYVYDEQEYDSPSFQMYGPEGLSAWMKANARPYLYSMDNGRLLNKGHSFGDDEKLSRDAIAIPLFGPSSDGPIVIGLASMQTYRSGVYTAEIAHAFQWLARGVVTILAREREDATNRELLSAIEGLPGESLVPLAEIVDDFVHKLAELHRGVEQAIGAIAQGQEAVQHELVALRELCERAQTETAELLMRPSVEARTLLAKLTPREKEIAQLIADGLSNDDIARRLVISAPTVKTHVTRILKKFGVRQRAAVGATLRPFG